MATSCARAAIAIISVPVLLLRAGVASADETEAPVDDQDRARTLFHEGRELARAGDYEHACPKLEESRRLRPGVSTDFNVADCWEHTGRLESAHELFLRVATVTHDLGDADRERAARARAKSLEARLVIPTTPVSPGPAPSAAAVATPTPVQNAEGPSTTPRWLFLGAAGAGAITAAVAFALYAHSDSQARDLCRSAAGCADEDIARHQSLVDDARTARAVGIAGLAITGASLLGATVFFIREHDASAAPLSAAFAGGRTAATLMVKGTF